MSAGDTVTGRITVTTAVHHVRQSIAINYTVALHAEPVRALTNLTELRVHVRW